MFLCPLRMMFLDPIRVMLVPPLARAPLMLLVISAIAVVILCIGPLRVLLIPVRMVLGDPVRIVLMPPVGVAAWMAFGECGNIWLLEVDLRRPFWWVRPLHLRCPQRGAYQRSREGSEEDGGFG